MSKLDNLQNPIVAKRSTSLRNEDDLWSIIDTTKAEFIALSDRVWATPELLFGNIVRLRNISPC